MLLAIDPGTDTGWALFDSARRLKACGLDAPPCAPGSVSDVVIECPERVYHGVPVGAILKLAAKAGEWMGRFAVVGTSARYVTPAEWIGGSVHKEANHPRIKAKLTPDELAILEAACARHPGARKGTIAKRCHNIVDAIGIGLFGVGR